MYLVTIAISLQASPSVRIPWLFPTQLLALRPAGEVYGVDDKLVCPHGFVFLICITINYAH